MRADTARTANRRKKSQACLRQNSLFPILPFTANQPMGESRLYGLAGTSLSQSRP